MNYYTVRNGEGICDVVLNSTGSLDNWELILDANGFDTWTPILEVDQVIIIPDTVVLQSNVLRILDKYPACNNSNIGDLDLQIAELIAIFEGTIIFRMDNNFNAKMDSTLLTVDQNL
jgi:hypothetical protein